MGDLSYYFSIFRRRLPYFLIVATIVSAVAVTVAYTLPPAYESRMILLVESPQIPEQLAPSTVQTPAFEQLQVVEQRLLTRGNMLDIARQYDVLPNLRAMNPDQIVDAMRARTTISTSNRRLKEAPLMTVTFEAPQARTAAEVLNAYLNLIQRQDTEFRKGRASETLAFFAQEVDRLSQELETQSARILEFKQANTEALPESLRYRLNQQSVFQDRIIQIDRDIADLHNQRARLMQLYELTGDAGTGKTTQSPEEKQLAGLNKQLEEALAVYSPENPRVKMLEARIAQLEEKLEQRRGAPEPEDEDSGEKPARAMPPLLIVQLTEIGNRIDSLKNQKTAVQTQLDKLNETIAESPEVSIELEDLTRRYAAIQAQYNVAEDRLSKAQTGDQIETRSRGQRIAVIEQPAIPSAPTKPNRILIASGGTAFGILAGLALVVLLEVLNTSARRPDDIIGKLGVTPLTTIPYIYTRGQRFRQRSLKLLLVLAILVGIPAAVYAIHIYYLPLDLLADRIMNKTGLRW
ncbi:MAG: lipopolysaccharide biosynthesis protein [Rhodobacteraceae bacterium]|nr:lipopolysaccharide biosynthesis protein [Paracoccaceae bacterium]